MRNSLFNICLRFFIIMSLSGYSYAMYYKKNLAYLANMKILAFQQARFYQNYNFYRTKMAFIVTVAGSAKAYLKEEEDKKSLADLAKKHGFIYLKHMTTVERLKEILDAKKLLPAAKTIHQDNGPLDEVYMALEPKDMVRIEDYIPCIIFFSLKILDERQDYHVTNGWVYGEYFHRDSFCHLLSATPDEYEKFEEVLTKIVSSPGIHGEGSEIVFTGPVDLRLVEKIYVGGGSDFGLTERKSLVEQIEKAGISVGIVGKVFSWHPMLLDK
jgi:hypothetical protein